MTDIDVAALRAAAEGATPGQWQTVCGEVVWIHETMIARADTQQDGRYIATASPAVVLALLDRLAKAESALDRVSLAADELDEWDGDACFALGGCSPGGVVRWAVAGYDAAQPVIDDPTGPQIKTEEQP